MYIFQEVYVITVPEPNDTINRVSDEFLFLFVPVREDRCHRQLQNTTPKTGKCSRTFQHGACLPVKGLKPGHSG